MQFIEFKDLYLIEHQMKMIFAHVSRLRGGEGDTKESKSNGTVDQVNVPLEESDPKVFNDLSMHSQGPKVQSDGRFAINKILEVQKWGDQVPSDSYY